MGLRNPYKIRTLWSQWRARPLHSESASTWDALPRAKNRSASGVSVGVGLDSGKRVKALFPCAAEPARVSATTTRSFPRAKRSWQDLLGTMNGSRSNARVLPRQGPNRFLKNHYLTVRAPRFM